MSGFTALIKAILAGLSSQSDSPPTTRSETPNTTTSRLAMAAIVFLGIALLLIIWKQPTPTSSPSHYNSDGSIPKNQSDRLNRGIALPVQNESGGSGSTTSDPQRLTSGSPTN